MIQSFRRFRRLRGSPALRHLVQETHLGPSHLVQPIFIKEGITKAHPIRSMPGQFQHTPRSAVRFVRQLNRRGVESVLLFGIPRHKDALGSSAWAARGVLQETVRLIKKQCPQTLVITDVCLCEYTSHSHCGHLKGKRIDNDSTLDALVKTALSHAESGADVIAPSDMMDGRVSVIRKALDAAGYGHLPILSYAAKFASAFYGPFRDAAENTPSFGDRRSYQMNPANPQEALREARADIREGADMILVKPAWAYLDILQTLSRDSNCPVGAYNVSGEYTLLKTASQSGFLDEKSTVLELLMAFRRAGAAFIITYWAYEAAEWLK